MTDFSKLTRGELIVAKSVGLMRSRAHRNLENLEGREPGSGHVWGLHEVDDSEPVTEDYRSAAAEMLVHKALGIFWADSYMDEAQIQTQLRLDPFRAVVVVRATRYPGGSLILHDADPDWDRPYVLVTGSPGDQKIVGWTYPGWAKKKRWWPGRGKRPCYMVPQAALRAFGELVPTVTFPSVTSYGDPLGDTRETA